MYGLNDFRLNQDDKNSQTSENETSGEENKETTSSDDENDG